MTLDLMNVCFGSSLLVSNNRKQSRGPVTLLQKFLCNDVTCFIPVKFTFLRNELHTVQPSSSLYQASHCISGVTPYMNAQILIHFGNVL